MKRSRLGVVFAVCGVGLFTAESAQAFCGFYVGGADAKLFNNATQVVLMREGTRTVLSMQNNYQGPPSNFAMVIPVPVVLQKENVKTLPREIFDKVDQLTSPRLVEYWEQDPCMQRRYLEHDLRMRSGPPQPTAAAPEKKAEDLGVRIEAQFTVGEYEIVILSAKDSTGLDTWLRQEKYSIPAGAEPYLRPYVQMGMKFFVAKVDTKKVKFERLGDGPEQAMLSPLRFHYDSEMFNLPIRLGLINSSGTQDLIVNILARGQRYEVANYENVAIPTNFNVTDMAKDKFGTFYTGLFDKTLEKHPRAVVTEYSWDASTCDPCPGPALDGSEFMTLGADVLPQNMDENAPPVRGRGRRFFGGGFVVTRLHARYTKNALGDDLFFRAAPPILGGREHVVGKNGELERGAVPGDMNNFQARYIIRHPWAGPVACKNPQRGIWGGPPSGGTQMVKPAAKIAFAPREASGLTAFVKGAPPPESLLSPAAATPMWVLPKDESGSPSETDAGTEAQASEDAGLHPPPPVPPKGSGCGSCSATERTTGLSVGFLAAVSALVASRWRKRTR